MRAYAKLALLAVVLALAVLAGRGTPAYAWTFPAALNTNAAGDSGDDRYPQVITDGSGNWVAAWTSNQDLDGGIGTDEDILVARSTDNGATWTPPAPLNTSARTDSEDDRVAEVTTDRAGQWVAVWQSDEPNVGGGIGTDRDILVARSTDNGDTWTPPAALNTNAPGDAAKDSVPQVTTDGSGNWVAVWQSAPPGTDTDILVARSTNNGATWTSPAPLNTNAAGDLGKDEYPQVTTDGNGHWVAVWTSNQDLGGGIGTDWDILVARSTDSGATWTPPAPLNTNAPGDLGDDWFPQLTTDGNGNWMAVWHSEQDLGGALGTDYDILVARSTDNGATWTPPVALNTNAPGDSEWDGAAQVTTDRAGLWVAVWYSLEPNVEPGIGTDTDILVARSTDNGATWTAPAALNANAPGDVGWDEYPQVTTDRAGHWVVVWQSEQDLGGVTGTDHDILYGTCSPADPSCPPAPTPIPTATPTATPAATPTATPAATQTPQPGADTDGDTVPDDVEGAHGSDPGNPDSTPEALGFDPDTCSDGVDNDGDGLIDGEDEGCRATRTLVWGPGWHNVTWSGASTPEEAFACAAGNYAAAYRLVSGGWERHFPDRPDLSNMTDLAQYDAFLILVTGDVTCEIPVADTPSTERTLDWTVGWQNEGWTGLDGTPPEDAFACAEGSYAAAYRLVSGGWERYFPDRPDLSNMGPLNRYDAFLILVTAPVSCAMPIAS